MSTTHPSPNGERISIDWPPETAEPLARVARLLNGGEPAAALAAVPGGSAPWQANARAVCLLRLGQHSRAADELRGLVFDGTGLAVRSDAHPVVAVNYATALLLGGNLDGFQGVLSGVRDRRHPAVVRLENALRRWRAGLSWGEWLRSVIGLSTRTPQLDYPPGEL